MAKSRRPRRKKLPSQASAPKPPGLAVSRLSVPEQDHAAFKEAMLKAAAVNLADLPSKIAQIRKHFSTQSPLQIIAALAMYSLSATVSGDGKVSKSANLLEQHHVELLQAIALCINEKEWGIQPINAEIVNWFFENIPHVSNSFLSKRLLKTPELASLTTEEMVVYSLQERTRLYTQIVRNWGHYADVVDISRRLYATIDSEIELKHGFTFTELITTMQKVLGDYERRVEEHYKILTKAVRGRNVAQVIRNYFKSRPDLDGSPDDLLAALPPGIDRMGAISFVMQHNDLRIAELSTFNPDALEAGTGISARKVDAILAYLSCAPGSLAGSNEDHLFLANPVWIKPGIALGGSYFFALPQAAFSHIHTIAFQLAQQAGCLAKLEASRAKFLENQVSELIAAKFPQASITPSAKWSDGGRQGETDVLVVVDRVVLIIEAKSHRLTPEALRGAPKRMKRHVQDLVLEPSLQSAKLESLINSAKSGDKFASAEVKKLDIEPSACDFVIRLSVTLDDFSIIASSEIELKEAGWIPNNHHLAPTIQLADLRCVFDLLEDEVTIIHYLSERYFFQKAMPISGDELDFLGIYLLTLLNIGNLEEHGGRFSPLGMSDHVDAYYQARDNGFRATKPKPAIQPYFLKLIRTLSERKRPGWTTGGIHLLNCADPSEQRQIERGLNELRANVRKNRRKEGHKCSLIVAPPQIRKAPVVFYLYSAEDEDIARDNIKKLVEQVLADGERERCVVFSRRIDRWDRPFETFVIGQMRDE